MTSATSPAAALSVRHLLGVADLTEVDYAVIFQTADEFLEVLQRPIKKVPSLREITVANLFFENSTRTKLSFELAEKRLSADVVNFSATGSSLSKGETLLDTVRNILAMKVDMVVMRHPSPGAPHFLSRHIPAVILNAGDGTHEHPTQALLDVFSLRKRFGQLKGLNVGIVGDIVHSRVALSNMLAMRKLGVNVKVCGPPTLIPKHIRALDVEVEYDFDAVLAWADAVNMLRIQRERMQSAFFPTVREYVQLFGLDSDRLDRLNKNLVVMHPGPINRGVELTSAVADGPNAIILDQVQHGVAIRMACLFLLASGIGYTTPVAAA